MNTQVSFSLRGRNPDVLTCIANLSNDEVFTPPEFANRMLDTLADAWAADHGGAVTHAVLAHQHVGTGNREVQRDEAADHRACG